MFKKLIKNKTITNIVNVHHIERTLLLLSGSILLKKFISQSEIPAKISMKKFTNGFIIIQRMEILVNIPNKINPNKICGP